MTCAKMKCRVRKKIVLTDSIKKVFIFKNNLNGNKKKIQYKLLI